MDGSHGQTLTPGFMVDGSHGQTLTPGFAILRTPNKDKTAVHDRHSPGNMVRYMCKVLANYRGDSVVYSL